MDFSLTPEQCAIRHLAQEFAEKEMAPFAAEWDEKNIFPQETLRKAASLGFAGINVKSEMGGSELSRIDSAIIFEELATACPSTAAYLSIHNMVSWLIDHYAHADIREKWLPKCVTMEVFTSYCLTEPSAGSDAASLKTTAVRDGDAYILNGSKAFISGGSMSDIYVCMVKTDSGITCLLVEGNQPGISFGKKEKKLGWHSQPTTMVFFENCRVPVSHRIGAEGQGFKIALSALNGGRLNISACSLGGAKSCLKRSQQYMLERMQFQHKLAEFEALQFKLADMITDLHASRLMVYRAAHALDTHHPDSSTFCAMAKRLATDCCFHICDQALQLHGGYGYLQDYAIERYFRDLRVHQILEGTNEIMRLIIAKNVFEKNFSMDYGL